MQTFDVLDPNTNLLGRYFLEASAGTGKTFAIENLIPRLILESKDPITIDQILVVTFTRAATRELKARIYQNLMKISLALQDGRGGPKYLEKVFIQGKEALQIARRKVEEACFSFEKAQIFTLHGFALSILQEFAFEAKFFTTSSLEMLDSREDLTNYIQDFLRTGLKEDFLSSTQIKKICAQKNIAKNSIALSKVLVKLLDRGQAIRTYKTAKECWTHWNECLASLPSVSMEDLWHDYGLIAPRLVKSKKWAEQVQFIFSLIEKGTCSFAEWDALLQEKELFLAKLSFQAKVKEPSYRYPGLFEKLHQLVPLHEEATDLNVLLLQLASASKEYYDKGKKDRSCFTPDDFIHRLKEALEESSFTEKVRDKYKALIIDEFQDTDADQWKIFQTIFLEEKKSCPIVYLVGDPKQSIYGFRSADVYIYLKAKGFFAQDHHFHLGTNFRAHPDLVEALNVLFSLNIPENWMLLPLSSESLSIRKVAFRSNFLSSFQDDKKGRIHFFLGEEKQERSKQWPSIDTEEKSLIPYMAQEIVRLRKENGLRYRQVAVLVKDRYQADRVQTVFSEYDIPCQMQKSLDVKGSAFELMKELLACLIKPSDISSLKKFLGGSLIGYAEEDIRGSWENPFLQKAREYFTLSTRQVRHKGFGAFFNDFLFSSAKDKEKTVAESLLVRKERGIYFAIRQLCQILLEHCPEGLYDPKVLFCFLEELQEVKPNDILQQFFEQEEDQVHVMTLHKSKGLEFDIVFALALGSRYTGKEDYISVRLNDGREIAALGSNEEVTLHTEEIDAEKLRQLYVALTRAKERVYVPATFGNKEKEVVKGTAAPIELFLGARGLSRYNFLEVYQKIGSFTAENMIPELNLLGKEASITYESIPLMTYIPSAIKEEILIPPLENSFSFKESFSLSFSSLSEESKKDPGPFYKNTISSESYSLPLGAETGTIIHEILETLCKAGLHQEIPSKILPVILERCKGSTLEGKEDVILEIVVKSLETPIVTEWGAIILAKIPTVDMQIEMEFLYPVGDSLLKGFIDLIFRYRGRYFLLDWKTNALGLTEEEYTEEKMQGCMQEHQYDLQAAIYACAIKKYLALFDKRPFRQIFGGAVYFFLRGKKPLFFYPELPLAKAVENGDLLWKEE
ncbi:MAG: UvrD-helicase domain-containing protein [Chlamydiota bacterium]